MKYVKTFENFKVINEMNTDDQKIKMKALDMLDKDIDHSDIVKLLSTIESSMSTELSRWFNLYRDMDATNGEMVEALENNLKQ